MVASLRQRMEQVNHWLLVLLAFCLPLSTSAVTIITFLFLANWVVQGSFREKGRQIAASPVCLAIFGFMGLLLAGLAWSQHLRTGFEVIEQHSKLLLLPVFLTAVRRDNRWPYLWAFVAGVVVIMLSAYLAWFGLLQYADVNSTHLTKKTFHVVYNPMLALAIYLVLHQIIWGGLGRWWRSGLALLAGIMIVNMFITEGRAGQLVFFVLMALLLAQSFRRNFLVAVAMIAVLLPLLGLGVYKTSPVFRERVDVAHAEIDQYKANPNTSVGLRLLYWRNSSRIIASHPWAGVGTGDFFSAYARINHLFSRAMPFTDNPHNQYIYILVQLGVLGLAVMLAPFAVQMLEARRAGDGWQRIRLAFPLFFLVIMLTESYLVIYETGMLFALLGAVLYAPDQGRNRQRVGPGTPVVPDRERSWLILSYRVNVPGSACSQHIDDRLPVLQRAGITPIVLSGPVGGRLDRVRHVRTWSLAPSGLRFELRHYLRKRCPRRWQFKLAETILLLPVMPLYLMEKMLINLESEWSWCFSTSFFGILLQRRYRPEAIYSTGGSASAHVAALVISKFAGVPWIAETQDPLVHDEDWQRSRAVYHLYRWLERHVATTCSAFVFLTARALENARKRVGRDFPGVVIYPGAMAPGPEAAAYRKTGPFSFAHFGSLAGSRNLLVFLEALHQFMQSRPEEQPEQLRIDLYGSIDQPSLEKARQLGLDSLIRYHGLVDRQTALAGMRRADCLLLIQNTAFFSTETIPSKVYEYLYSGRPILGLIHHNQELTGLLRQRGHFTVPAGDPVLVQRLLTELIAAWIHTDFASAFIVRQPVMLETAVQTLVGLIPAPQGRIMAAAAEEQPSEVTAFAPPACCQGQQTEPFAGKTCTQRTGS